ncbi:fructose-bisphosphate aldolase [Flexivirga endophytica]|uniref:Fructose-bisphosphate aldolase n=1 Tax=Flexivirga endophytica TaxID=1849103 RepID=A0A916SVC5_9MICO|nr:class II fructose-bisphosphate aldolase [Flexivirga endophytica]GGB19733.1 fructose-bisphosphate aldolase [Flexivirga endophytica]GHB35986.1 fructose-bisphosphate aldolase [Flexivirga endophytica]
MTLASTADLVAAARDSQSCVFAFNVVTLEHAEAIAAGATAAGKPCILQLSHNSIDFHHDPAPITAAMIAVARAADVPLAIHLDHITDADLAVRAAELGASSVMFDAGALPYSDNVATTADVTRRAHDAGLYVEAELGYVGGKPGSPVSAHAAGVRTDPIEATSYVAATGVDALAVAVGSSHAMTDKSATLDHELISALRDATGTPLVLHGSSGVPDEQLRAAVSAGMVKINVGTALNIAFTGAVRDALADTEKVDPRPYLRAGRDAMAAEVERLLRAI